MGKGAFDWDRMNLGHVKLHNVSRIETEDVILGDPIYDEDTPDYVDGEERFRLYGETRHGRLLGVVYTIRGARIRVITAWDMDAHERKWYLEVRTELL
jgi:uncharacterized DUF497 family protein